MRPAMLVFAIAMPWLIHGSPSSGDERRPNIVIILADDLGYADLGCQGCRDIPTPHIDSIAKNGVRCTDGYATHPVCSPSRAGLISGMYQHRFGFEHNSGPERYASPKFGVPRSIPTLAERLKKAGYATAMAGKWHIGFKEGMRPHERGFDFHYGFLSGARSFYPDSPQERDPIIRNGEIVKDEKDYLTDAFGREAAAFIDRSKDQPFFLYLAFNAVHTPLEATPEYEARFPHITDRKRKTYAGMTAAMDDAVGDVLGKLREHRPGREYAGLLLQRQRRPTWQTTSRNDPLRGFKGDMFEGGIRVPFLVQWKGKLPAGKVYREMVMGFDVHATALAAAGFDLQQRQTPRRHRSSYPTWPAKNRAARMTDCSGEPEQNTPCALGDWKLVKPRNAEPMLFNLEDDIAEQNDLAGSNPREARAIAGGLRRMGKGHDACPMDSAGPAQRRTGRQTETGSRENQYRRRGRFRLDEAFRNADKDRDGKLTRRRIPAARSLPQR